jgi:hypothetical protein
MRPSRFRVKTLLIALAAVAIVLEGIRVKQWHDSCLARVAGPAFGPL